MGRRRVTWRGAGCRREEIRQWAGCRPGVYTARNRGVGELEPAALASFAGLLVRDDGMTGSFDNYAFVPFSLILPRV